ncbi:capsular biosynthesis protein [Micromonospora echinospora]|uniref:Poly-gamma-glutamate biosynthesis protein CapA/YwtB (Capsule formation), metallophosphatase superfamily n=1 Tax=Micromonospora echinospora TaxID=1877 RepID=A0A1C4WRE0_MICEC|nr:CapA family protein [Micromonospora echinospora]OZV79665.1 capsular biosynthesis protein [Micromonospora echinospora]SCE98770.1 Poly-gamma-glutamate biosynthesis protein CapA/YwtB (capsule formation), metallophosphatase superfamily [Micromonospora echinospora]
MYAAAFRDARRSRRRPAAALGVLLALLLATGCGPAAESPAWQPADDPTAAPAPASPSAPPAAEEEKVVSLSATGDIIIGNAPNRLPPNGGKGFFDGVKTALEADLVMGNLEEPLTVDTGAGKCGANSTRCFQFRAPPEYAAHLSDAGFHLLNQANNHGYDYGPAGYKNTQKALEEHGLKHTGAPDQITVVDVKGVKVAVAGFSSYVWSNSLVDIDAATKVIEKAATMADLVVVQVHMGAEGSEKTRVKPGTEMFLGENRGDPVKFSRAMIDAGADLIVGHGPHVLRAMEFYQGRLIAYSLGNFAGGGNSLSNNGRLGWGGVLKVSLKADGTFVEGSFASTYMNSIGKPVTDPDDRGLGLLKTLTGQDFPKTGARFAADGAISAPDAG